jgi:hypothetical protein
LEFVQPWDYPERLRQIKELALGNATLLSFTFHVGNSEAERERWKQAFPSLAETIDKTPRFEARPQHGMPVVLSLPLEFWIEHLEACKQLGLINLMYPLKRTSLSPADAARLTAAGEGWVLADMIMGEDTSKLGSGYSLAALKAMHAPRVHGPGQTPTTIEVADPLPETVAELDLQMMHDWFLLPYRAEAAAVRAMGARHLLAIEATTQMRLAMEAGVDLPILELVPHDPLPGLAAVRGAAKAYHAPLWGVHTALGYYQAPTDGWTPERLQIAYNLFYAGGASVFSEPNLALQNWGLCSGFFTIPASPPMREGEAECRPFDDPVCVRAREVVAEHYRFTQFDRRPPGGPRFRLGVMLGHLDGYTGGHQDFVWCVDDPAFAAGPAEAMWRHFHRLFDSEQWYTPPRKYYWQADPNKPLRYGTPPCGQVDIVPSEAPLDVLQSYGCLVFLGWNTMTPELYDKLRTYVSAGGRLLMSVPQLSAQLRRDAPLQLMHDGDYSDLFGVRIMGPGRAVEEVQIVAQSEHPPYRLPTGALYLEPAPLAAVELRGARVLATARDSADPLLVEHRYGEGLTWLLTTWEYPGERLDAFITDVLRTIAEGEQGEIALLGEGVDYAVYDGAASDGSPLHTIYLVNKSIYGQPQYPCLALRGHDIPIRVGGYEMRLAWLYEDLLIAPFDRWVQVSDVQRSDDGYRISLHAEPGMHRIQLAHLSRPLTSVQVDGKPQTLTTDIEGAVTFECRLTAASELVVKF